MTPKPDPSDMEDPEKAIPRDMAWNELYRHTLTKGLQGGTTVGTLVGLPYALYKGPRALPNILGKTGRAALLGGAIGLSLMAPVTYLALKDQDDYAMFDRAYRLRHNLLQRRCDQFGAFSGSVFAVIAPLINIPGVAPMRRTLYGAAIGTAVGVVLHVATAGMVKEEQ
mmetsp:Transcript_48535/g.125933  ORF Transcript_48535/g.125933 Transcript_48535/m.125933 type:complete len:168 (-) Transcript_48535:419-922(-)